MFLADCGRMTWHRLGHRGAFLLFLAILDFLYGYSIITEPVPGLGSYDTFLPVPAWGWIWVGVGVICLLRAPFARDRVAYASAAGLKVAWAGLFAHLWLIQDFPRGWVSVVIWLCFAATVLIISSWPEPYTYDGKP